MYVGYMEIPCNFKGLKHLWILVHTVGKGDNRTTECTLLRFTQSIHQVIPWSKLQ
jgi:hypothetical protein